MSILTDMVALENAAHKYRTTLIEGGVSRDEILELMVTAFKNGFVEGSIWERSGTMSKREKNNSNREKIVKSVFTPLHKE